MLGVRRVPVVKGQGMAAGLDCTMCSYIGYNRDTIERLAGLLSAYFGEPVTLEDLADLDRSIRKTERGFNLAAGTSPAADRLPEFFYTEPIEPDGHVFDLSDPKIQYFYDLPLEKM